MFSDNLLKGEGGGGGVFFRSSETVHRQTPSGISQVHLVFTWQADQKAGRTGLFCSLNGHTPIYGHGHA